MPPSDRRIRRAAVLVACLLLSLWGPGCSDEPRSAADVEASSSVNPAAASALIEAQGAYERADYRLALALADTAESRSGEGASAFLADVAFLRAQILTAVNRDEDARAAYERVLELGPDYPGAWLNLGNNAFRGGRFDEAITAYRQEQQARPSPKNLVYIGRAYAELGEVDSARAAYEEAIEADENHAEAYLRLSQLHEREGSYEEALRFARRAQAVEPEDAGSHYLVGLLAYRTGRLEEALGRFEYVVGQRPRDFEAHYNLGQVLTRLGRAGEAAEHLRVADSLRTIEAQLSEWATLTQVQPEEPAVWATYGYALRRAGYPEEARRAYMTALYLDAANLDVRLELANLLLENDDPGAALQHYRVALRQDSTLVGAWLNAGIAHARAGDYPAAREAWQRVLTLEAGHPQAREYLARISAR